jgi:peptidoglycan hydrolase CwlO-like protein
MAQEDNDNVHDFTGNVLRKIQGDIAAFRHEVIKRLDKTDASVSELQTAVAATRADLAIVKNDIEDIKGDIKDAKESISIITARPPPEVP